MGRARFGTIAVGAAVVVGALAACGSSGTTLTTAKPATQAQAASTTSASTTAQPVTTADYHPTIVPADFSVHVTNRYLPLVPGTTRRYTGLRDGQPTFHVIRVTNQTKTVMGVRCIVVEDNVSQNGSLIEKTTDWYAQDKAGNVWYFGETTAELQNGVVTSTKGTWEAGVDNALPGMVMTVSPRVGQTFRQEFRPGVALDIAVITAVDGATSVPAGPFRNLVVTLDKNPLDPSKIEHKFYASGIGFVRAELHGGGHTEITGLVK